MPEKSSGKFYPEYCNSCDFIYTTDTSKQVSHGVPEQNPFDINACAVVGFREIGKGHSAIETLFWFMNFIHVMDKDSFNE